MKLNEQNYKNSSRPYYRGIPYEKIDYTKSRYNCIYFTNKFVYAAMYSYKGNNEHGFVYEYRLTENADVFNAKAKRDVLRLKSAIRKQLESSKEFANALIDFSFDDSFFGKLSTYDWASFFKDDKKRDLFVEVAKAAGFDGYFNFEWHKKTLQDGGIEFGFEKSVDRSPSIGMFSADKMKVIRRYSFDEFFQFDDFVEAHNEDLEKLQQYVSNLYNNGVDEYEDLSYDFAAENLLFLDSEEVADIVSDPEKLDESLKNTTAAKLFRECMNFGKSENTYNGFRCYLNENYKLVWSKDG